MEPGPVYTLLEVPGKEDLEPLTLGYYQDKHYRSLRKNVKIHLERSFYRNIRKLARIVEKLWTRRCWKSTLLITG